MLPRAEVDIFYRVDIDALRAPTASDIESGVTLNRDHEPSVAMRATWELAATRLAEERETVARLAAKANDDYDFENLAFEELSEFGLDLGVEAACIALCAAGCVTGMSCRGHPEPESPWSTFPVIVFLADRERAPLVEAIARRTDCALSSAREGHLELWAASVVEIMDFTELLIALRADFDELSRPRAFAEAFADKDDDGEDGLTVPLTWIDPDQQELF